MNATQMRVSDEDKADISLVYNPTYPVTMHRPVKSSDPSKDYNFEIFCDLSQRKLLSHRHTGCCFKYGHSSCRFLFPRPEFVESFYDEDKSMMELKRTGPYLNTHNDLVTYLMRCNNDISMIATAHD